MVKKQTWVLLAVFLVLAGIALFLKYNPKGIASEKDATPLPTDIPIEYLIPKQESVASLTISSRGGEIVGLEARGGKWVGIKPVEAEADQASVGEAISQLTAITVLAHLDLRPEDTGLLSPANTIVVGFSDGTSMKVQIGDATPTKTGYYARKEDGSILVVDKYGVDALLNLLISPPFEDTPTPSPAPPTQTPTPTVTLPAIETPAPTATKQP